MVAVGVVAGAVTAIDAGAPVVVNDDTKNGSVASMLPLLLTSSNSA